MYIVHVHIQVKPEFIDEFKKASLENARASLTEPGIARFDVLHEADAPTRFVLVEIYHTPDDPAKHKETAHYKAWRETAEPMMAQARTRTVYANIFPEDSGW
jgi:quinol monooxygenase YgiN